MGNLNWILSYHKNLPESRAAVAADGGGLSWIGGGLSYLGGGLSYTAGFSRITGGGLSRITGGAGACACLDLTLDGADDGFLKKKFNRFFKTAALSCKIFVQIL